MDHTILGEKLKGVGVIGDIWVWVMDHLSSRRKTTQILGEYSESKLVKIGVPQGSLLDPRLFTTYVDLPGSFRSGEAFMFADDTTIYTIGSSTYEVVISLQEILDQLQ